jgi:histidine triad (HIT) family protein
VIPKIHYETLTDLPPLEVGPLFMVTQRVAAAVERAMQSEGSFVAINNRVSQSVPHLHIHVVPRRKKDGLRGFFWPRQKYESAAEMERVRDRLREALALTGS